MSRGGGSLRLWFRIKRHVIVGGLQGMEGGEPEGTGRG